VIKKATSGESAVTQDGRRVTIKQVYHGVDKRVMITTDKGVYMAWDLKRPDGYRPAGKVKR
jgi:hypothetical protein